MRTTILLLLCAELVVLSSCAYDDYEATSSTGNRVKEKHVALGGTSSIKRSDGSSLVEDLQTSFRDGTNMVQTSVLGIAAGNISKAKTASDNLANTTQAKNASDAATANAKIAADSAKTAGQQAIAKEALDKGVAIPAKP